MKSESEELRDDMMGIAWLKGKWVMKSDENANEREREGTHLAFYLLPQGRRCRDRV